MTSHQRGDLPSESKGAVGPQHLPGSACGAGLGGVCHLLSSVSHALYKVRISDSASRDGAWGQTREHDKEDSIRQDGVCRNQKSKGDACPRGVYTGRAGLRNKGICISPF